MAYIALMLAKSAWAVQMFEVALSLLMCCSLVWRAILKAKLSCLSDEIPMILPGIFLTFSFLSIEIVFVAKNAAWGPPKPIGIPNLWAEPKQISAPICPGGFVMVKANKSEATTLITFDSLNLLKVSVKSWRDPLTSGVWTKKPKN